MTKEEEREQRRARRGLTLEEEALVAAQVGVRRLAEDPSAEVSLSHFDLAQLMPDPRKDSGSLFVRYLGAEGAFQLEAVIKLGWSGGRVVPGYEVSVCRTRYCCEAAGHSLRTAELTKHFFVSDDSLDAWVEHNRRAQVLTAPR